MTRNTEYHTNDRKGTDPAGAEESESGSRRGFVLWVSNSSRDREATNPRS